MRNSSLHFTLLASLFSLLQIPDHLVAVSTSVLATGYVQPVIVTIRGFQDDLVAGTGGRVLSLRVWRCNPVSRIVEEKERGEKSNKSAALLNKNEVVFILLAGLTVSGVIGWKLLLRNSA